MPCATMQSRFQVLFCIFENLSTTTQGNNQNIVPNTLCFLLYRKDRRKVGMSLWKKNALLFVLASSSRALVLFTEVRPQSPLVSKIIGTGNLGDQLMHVLQLPYKADVAVNASGL